MRPRASGALLPLDETGALNPDADPNVMRVAMLLPLAG
jgi:hypothetical protein